MGQVDPKPSPFCQRVVGHGTPAVPNGQSAPRVQVKVPIESVGCPPLDETSSPYVMWATLEGS